MFGFWWGFCYCSVEKYTLLEEKTIDKMKIFYYPFRFENCIIKDVM